MAELDLPAWSEPFVHEGRAKLLRAAGLRQLDRDWAWGDATGAGVKVAIIDSGVEGSHPVVRGRLVESVTVQIVGDETKVVPDEPIDMYGHATACAATEKTDENVEGKLRPGTLLTAQTSATCL